jgi:hypothetical protein
MTFLDLQTAVESMSIVTSQPLLIQQALQFSLNRVSQEFEFPYFLNSKGVITTTAPYATGTVTSVVGSTTIVGVGTTWTSAMVGRKFQIQGDQGHYYISVVNSPTNITLAVPYQGTAQSGVTYNIYKDEYKLASDVQSYNTIVQIENSIPMVGIAPSRFDQTFPTQQSFDSPYLEMMEGTQLDVYSTGTVTTTNFSTALTGVGTSWTTVEGLGRMTNIIISSNRYTVQSVNNDTSITLYEQAIGSIAGSTYQLLLRNYKTQVFPIPYDVESLYYRYYRMPDIMVNNYDVPDLPNDWHWLIAVGALAWIYLQKGDVNKAYTIAEANFMKGINMMKKKMGNPSGDRIYNRQSQDRRSRPLDGLEKGTFDRRFSGF